MLLGCLGLGAVMAAFMLPKVRRRVSTDRLLIGATILYAIATFALAYLNNLILVCVALVAAGVAWISMMSSLNAAAQLAVPRWVQARALGVYQLVFQGGIAAGSAFWGIVSEHLGNPTALLGASIGLMVGLLAALRYRLIFGEKLDFTPSSHWSEPHVVIDVQPEDGPVLITVEYCIDPQRSQEFTKAMHDVSISRRRDGAIRWGLFHDTAMPNRYLETFVVESWAEHLRQHERVTVADRSAQEYASSFHIGDAPPVVSHLIYAHEAEGVS